MKNDKSYLPLISEWENYLKISNKADLKGFAYWLLEKDGVPAREEDVELSEYFGSNTNEHKFAYKSSEAAFLIWRLGKFIRHYTKPILLGNGLAGQDDFAILSHVDYKTSCSKKEAIEANIIEPTTGIEIIKRLIKAGLLSEKVNKDDKREKIISLTKIGKEKLYQIYVGFAQIQDLMAEMNVEQRENLIQTLTSLDTFHTSNLSVP